MTSPITRALLLTAGLGTRLRPLTDARAKPSLPVAGEPLVSRIIRALVAGGVSDLVLNLHYRPDTITREVGDGAHLGARIRYSWEGPEILGSAGGPRLATPVIGTSPFFIVNGDTLTDVDLAALAAAHQRSKALVTLALVENRAPHRYGGVQLDGAGTVTGFVKRGPEAVGSYHFIGVQVAAADAFAGVTLGTGADSIGGVYNHLIATAPGSIHGHLSDAGFWDIGTARDYWQTSLALTSDHDVINRGAAVEVHPSAVVRRSILWDRVEIGAGASLVDCIVTDDVRIPPGARYREMILSAGADRRPVAVPLAAASTE